ncbi:MAG: CHC2 zinc finger domain-containing protein [Moorellaceae bacterium]
MPSDAIITQDSAVFGEKWLKFLENRGILEPALRLGWRELDGRLVVEYPLTPVGDGKPYRRTRSSPNAAFKNPKGRPPQPYFVIPESPAADVCFIVEGETDVATAFGAGFPVLGLPGAGTWRQDWWQLLEDFSKVVVVFEPDAGGLVLLQKLAETCPWPERVLVTSPPLAKAGWVKDLNELHVYLGRDFTRTRQALEKLVTNARPLVVARTREELLSAIKERLQPVTEEGDDYKALCPFHYDRNPSLDFGPKGWTCFGCGAGEGGTGRLDILGGCLGVVLLETKSPQAADSDAIHPYGIHDGRLVLWKKVEGTPVPITLSNFDARITEEVVLDDGAERRLQFKIGGSLADGTTLPTIIVPADKFTSLGWVTGEWGAKAVVNAGNSSKDHLRAAIQLLSNPVRRTVYSHLGWRQINDRWVFLHGNGALGAEGVEVVPEADCLRRYVLPSEPEPSSAEVVRLALEFLKVAPLEMTLPLFAAVWRAPLNSLVYAPLMLWVYGETGTFKSTIAALALSFFGTFDKDSLPASWTATEAFLERLAFLARDVFLCIDDFAPEFSKYSQEELSRKVSRVVRQAGNRAYRGRMRPDLTLRPEYPPNALIISTAEQLPPPSMSLIGRTFLVKFERDKVDTARLTALQKTASALSYAMRAYLEWLRPQLDNLIGRLQQRLIELRQKAVVEGHTRLPENVAHLMLGMVMFTTFAVSAGALTQKEKWDLDNRAWSTLLRLAQQQAKVMREERPTAKFLTALSQLLNSGDLLLLDRETARESLNPEPLGSGEFAGWFDEEGLYLLPDVVWRATSNLLRDEGGLGLGKRAVFDMLVKEGFAIGAPGRHTRLIKVKGAVKRVLHLRPDALARAAQAEEE